MVTQRKQLLDEAVYWLRTLHSKGVAEATYTLGLWYEDGLNGFTRDYEKAADHYQIATKSNHPDAAYACGKYFETRREPRKAFTYYQKASVLGNTSAMYRIGMAYLNAELKLNRDLRQGLMHLRRSADNPSKECADGAYTLALMYFSEFDGPDVTAHVFPDEQEGRRLMDVAASLEHPRAMLFLGRSYEFGYYGYPADPTSSILMYKAAAEKGNLPEAMMAMSGWCLSGSQDGAIQANDKDAMMWAGRAAMLEHPKALFAMGYYYECGVGVPVSAEKAKEFYERAAKAGDTDAIKRLKSAKLQQSLDKEKAAAAAASGNGGSDLRRKATERRQKKQKEKSRDCSLM